MSYALVEDVAASWESYQRFAAALERTLPDGLILHAAGRTDEGFRIIEVWETKDAWQCFADALNRFDEGRFSNAPRYLRELRPTHLVLGREVAEPTKEQRG